MIVEEFWVALVWGRSSGAGIWLSEWFLVWLFRVRALQSPLVHPTCSFPTQEVHAKSSLIIPLYAPWLEECLTLSSSFFTWACWCIFLSSLPPVFWELLPFTSSTELGAWGAGCCVHPSSHLNKGWESPPTSPFKEDELRVFPFRRSQFSLDPAL